MTGAGFILAIPLGERGAGLPEKIDDPARVCAGKAALWIQDGTALLAGTGHLVIGPAFSRSDFRPVGNHSRLLDGAEELAGAARRLSREVWGAFCAALYDQRSRRIAILTDPSGLLPVYRLRTGKHEIYASSPALLAGLTERRMTIDPVAVAAHLLQPDLLQRQTCLAGIEQLIPGSLYLHGAGSMDPVPIWNARDHINAAESLSFSDHVLRLRETGIGVLQAWSREWGRVGVATSGGVDSSFICAALACAAEPFDCATFATSDPGGDERRYARLVADTFAARCAERIYHPDLFDPARSASAGLAAPVRRGFQHVLDDLVRDITDEIGCEVMFDGNAGDNIFCFLNSAAPVIDRLLAEGPGRGALATMLDMCRVTDCPVPAMVSATLRRIVRPRSAGIWGTETGLLTREAAGAVVAPLSDWLDQTPAPPGKREHLALMMQGQNQIHSLNAGVRRFSPLASQPLVECCLRIPSWEWASGGINRAVARAAFATELPGQVTARTSKTGPDSFLRQAYAVHRTRIAGQLLDGILVAEHIVDRAALEHALATDVLRDDQTFGRVLDILEAENWARSWTA
mgnify:CR=1 FL=1